MNRGTIFTRTIRSRVSYVVGRTLGSMSSRYFSANTSKGIPDLPDAMRLKSRSNASASASSLNPLACLSLDLPSQSL